MELEPDLLNSRLAGKNLNNCISKFSKHSFWTIIGHLQRRRGWRQGQGDLLDDDHDLHPRGFLRRRPGGRVRRRDEEEPERLRDGDRVGGGRDGQGGDDGGAEGGGDGWR